MASIVDTLLVEIGLDVKKFERGQRDVQTSMGKTKAELDKHAKDMEASAKRVTGFFKELQLSILGVFAAFTAGRGLKDFIADITVADAAIGRTARSLDMTVESLTAWQGAAKATGGSAAGITSSMQSLNQSLNTFLLTGESAVIPYLRTLGIGMMDSSGRIRDTGKIFLDLADKFSHMDPARAVAFGKAMGLDEATINMLQKGRGAVQAYLKEAERVNVVHKADTEAAQKLQEAWAFLTMASESLGRTIMTWLTPVLVRMTEAFTNVAVWARQHGDFLKALFTGLAVAATALGGAIAFALLGPLALFVPLVALAIGAGALLWDDWQHWLHTGRGAFGDFYEFVRDKWKEMQGFARPVIDAWLRVWKDLWQDLKDGWAAVKATFLGTSDEIRNAWSHLGSDMKKAIDDFMDYIKKLGPRMVDAFKEAFTPHARLVQGPLERHLGRARLWDAIPGRHWRRRGWGWSCGRRGRGRQ